jgi:hypothetical protein
MDELSRTCSIGKLIKNITIPRHALATNGGPQSLRGMPSTADYKGDKGTQILSYGVCSYLLCGFL